MMEEFVTRQEFEELKQSLQVIGDGQTISVQQTAGGQLLESLMAPAAPAGEADAETSPISITYDADDNYYTITITDLPYRLIAQQAAAIQDAAHTLLFHTPAPIKIKANQTASINLHFEYYPKVDSGLPTSDYHVLWSNNSGGVGYDEISTKVEIDSEFNGAEHNKFQTIVLQADGAGSELQISELYPVETSPRIANNSLQIVPTLSSNKIIRYSVTWTGFSCISGNNGSIGFSGFITTAIDDDIIIGFIASSNTERLDIAANSGLYTDSSVVGHVKTVDDGDGNLLLKQFYTTAPPLFPFFGATGTWGITTTVGTRYFRFRNGILTQVTT